MIKIPFFRIGEWKHPKYGVLRGTDKKLSDFIDNFKNNSLGRPPFVRIGHDKAQSKTFGDAKALAWIKDIKREGDVIYALAEATDPKVEESIRSGMFRFASAEYDENYVDKETGKPMGAVLSAIALTNEPFLTKLPENIVLSEESEEFYMDCEEGEARGVMEEILTKLSDTLTLLTDKFKFRQKEESGTSKEVEEEEKEDKNKKEMEEVENEKVLAELEEVKKKLADLEKANEQMKGSNKEKDIEIKLSSFRAQGIPPSMCDKAKEILLSLPEDETIKLSDGGEKKTADAIYELLESLPEGARVDFNQYGSQFSRKLGDEISEEELKRLADEDIKALGGTIGSDGRYII